MAHRWHSKEGCPLQARAKPPGRVARVPAARCPQGRCGDYRWTLDSGPALFGKLAVFTTWMPACCSPLKDRKSTRLNSSHTVISYAVFCLKKKNKSQPDGQE